MINTNAQPAALLLEVLRAREDDVASRGAEPCAGQVQCGAAPYGLTLGPLQLLGRLSAAGHWPAAGYTRLPPSNQLQPQLHRNQPVKGMQKL